MRKLLIIGALAALALTGCKKKEEGGGGDTTAQKPDDGAQKPDDTAQKPDDGAKPDDSGGKAVDKMRNKMKHCPNSIEGANTSFEKTDKGVKVIISHDDEAKLKEVKDRSEHLAGVAGKPEPDIKHTGQGTGGGDTGHCPVGFKNVKVTVSDAKGAVHLMLEPMEGLTIDDVYKTVKERTDKMTAGGGHEHGSGKGGGGGGGGGKGEGEKAGKAGKASKKDGHEHGTGSGAGAGGGGKGAKSGNKDGTPGK